MIQIIDAITSLVNGASCVVKDNYEIIWTDLRPQPSDAEIDAEVIRLQAIYDTQDYARKRKAKYDLLNQDEMRFDDQVNSTTTWVDAIVAIKAEFPKP